MLVISTIHFSLIKNILFQKASSVVASCWKPGILESGHVLSLQDTGLHCKMFLAVPWILTITWSEKLVTFFFYLLQ